MAAASADGVVNRPIGRKFQPRACYHQVSDSVEKINFDSMEKVARTILATGWELANRPTRPKVDKPLPASVIGAN